MIEVDEHILEDIMINLINQGYFGIIPTDTVYALVCNALSDEAVMSVLAAKKMKNNQRLSILASDFNMICKYIKEVDDITIDLMKSFWPGKLNIVAKRSPFISEYASFNNEVSFRIPDNDRLNYIISKLGYPIVATCANIGLGDPVNDFNKINPELKKLSSFAFDGGIIDNFPCTTVKVEDGIINIERQGIMDEEVKTFIKKR